jgi:hypothetical protein
MFIFSVYQPIILFLFVLLFYVYAYRWSWLICVLESSL